LLDYIKNSIKEPKNEQNIDFTEFIYDYKRQKLQYTRIMCMNENIIEVFELALRYTLGYEGATYVEENHLKNYIKSKSKQYKFNKKEVEPCLNEINKELKFDLIYDSDKQIYYFKNEYDAEKKIIDFLITQKGRVRKREVSRYIKSAERVSKLKYSFEQKAAITSVFQNGFSVITGGPGTGKTTIIRGIYEVAVKLGFSVRIFAPTGKAAIRIQQATGLSASTIHKGLTEEILSHGKNIIIIDEASMIDSYLMGLIIEHWGMFTLVLTGDINQLSSVGNGEILYDIINSGMVPITYLTEGYRSKQTIITNADMSLNNMLIKDWKFDNSFRFIPVKFRNANDEYELIDKQVNRFKEMIYNYWRHLTYKYEITDVIVLVPLKVEDIEKEKFITSDTINKYIQSKIFEKIEEENKYYIGDRVIYTQNRYDLFDENGNSLFNGMTGTVVSYMDEGFITVQFDNGSKFKLHEDDDNLELSYALTVHKAQGSEYKAVVFITMNSDGIYRNLCYTAITRAKNEVIILGRYDVLSKNLNTNDNRHRTTFLKKYFSIPAIERLNKLFYEDGDKWNDECLIYDKNYFTFPSDKHWLKNRNNCIIKSDSLANGIYSHEFTKNEMKVFELYFASIKISDAATRYQSFELKSLNNYRTGRISESHLIEISKKFNNLYITVEALHYNKKKNAEIEDEWPYVKISRNKDGKIKLKVFDVCEWDKSNKKFLLQISDELIPYVFRIQPITGYIKEYYVEFVDRMSPKDALLFNFFRRYIGQSLFWTYEKLSNALKLKPGTYETVSDFNKFFRELNKSISSNTDMQISFKSFQEKGKNGHLYQKYRIDISEKPINIEIHTMPNPDSEKREVINPASHKILAKSKSYHVVRKWENDFHEIVGTEYLRLVDMEKKEYNRDGI
jgi:RecD/TraA family predicted helicase